MKDEFKYIILFVISIILMGLFTTIYVVDNGIAYLILAIVSLLLSIGSFILYRQEHKENNYFNRKRKSGKRFK